MATMIPSNSEKQHIESVPGRCGGKPCIVGHRIRVQDIVQWTQQGQSPAEIVQDFPQLTLADVHAALAYYFDHQTEIDRQIAAGDALAEAHHAQQGPGPMGEPN